MVARTGWRITLRFRTMTGSLNLRGMAAVLVIGLAGPVGAQPPPGPRCGPGRGPSSLVRCRGLLPPRWRAPAVAPPPPPMDVAPPPSDPYPYYAPAPPRRVYWRQHR